MANNWFPKIETSDGARKIAKQGTFGVLIFALMNLLGVLFAYYLNKSPIDQQAIDAQSVQEHIVGAFMVMPLLLFFAYRIYRGKGWIVAGVALTWFVAEAGLKIASGSTNVGWIFFYVVVAGMMLNGLRACWWLRKEYRVAAVASDS
jgi:hypothetical protein